MGSGVSVEKKLVDANSSYVNKICNITSAKSVTDMSTYLTLSGNEISANVSLKVVEASVDMGSVKTTDDISSNISTSIDTSTKSSLLSAPSIFRGSTAEEMVNNFVKDNIQQVCGSSNIEDITSVITITANELKGNINLYVSSDSKTNCAIGLVAQMVIAANSKEKSNSVSGIFANLFSNPLIFVAITVIVVVVAVIIFRVAP